MPYRITFRMKPTKQYPQGRDLVEEYPEREQAEAQLRNIAQLRQARWGLPGIYIRTVEDEHWCLGYREIAWPPLLEHLTADPDPVPAG